MITSFLGRLSHDDYGGTPAGEANGSRTRLFAWLCVAWGLSLAMERHKYIKMGENRTSTVNRIVTKNGKNQKPRYEYILMSLSAAPARYICIYHIFISKFSCWFLWKGRLEFKWILYDFVDFNKKKFWEYGFRNLFKIKILFELFYLNNSANV